ncbi:amino acid adenylation domain-containing protein [Couchioplanes caeruleus]|uniref:Non-ribosomal peptide synthetase n=2 Tax=Couchioplanes caeruleus TaxID=56438 RepID=A0A1K0GFC1_9ACTN|nr:non-ribosomal peptide synthetase [Couchioplanes caeruleus]OJF15954.1 non-ribosomal peptide synthetase [Couchioplanes caeruleus subsp. caeruleus]ROP28545.1 amino acid adenylation domain-containing protein [Couchioplanes caeruleus]
MNAESLIPLTAYQRDVWAASSHFPGLPRFNVAATARLAGNVDLAVLKECCERAIARNDAFTLRFGDRDGVPVQWRQTEPARVDIHDFSAAPDPAARCRSWMERAARRPVDLTGRRLYELALLRESDSVSHLYGTVHHIIVDGWGADQLVRQILADYAHAARTGRALEITPGSYLAHVEEHARYQGSDRWERDRDFYRSTFADVRPALFPARNPAAAGDGARRTDRHTFMIERDLVDRIRHRQTSVFSFLTAALATYLARVHRTEEVVLGIPHLNRHNVREKRTVGHFANMLPLRVPVRGTMSTSDIATEIATATVATKRHERLSLGDVLRALPSSAEGPRRLFDVTVSYLRLATSDEVPGLSVEKAQLSHGHDQDALTVYIREYDDNGAVRVDLDYALDVFDEDFTIASAARHLETLIRHAVDDPHTPVRDLAMISGDETHDLVRRNNDTRRPYRADVTLHALIAEQAARTPDRIAVAGNGTEGDLTYADLDARATVVARALRERGVRPDDRVAVRIERSPGLVVALVGVLKAGGAYVPIDPGYPPDRIQFLLADSGAKAVLTAHDPALRPDAGPVTPLAEAASPHSLAYVIYTSGSTGRPKGVMIEHHSVVNRLAWMQRRYPIGADDVVLQKTPSSFDVSVWELFWWAVEGARVALLPPGAEKEPGRILHAIAEHGVTVLHFVPSLFGPFLDLLESSPERRAEAASLRYVFCSGEALPATLVERFHRVFATAEAPRLVNLYGPTEATVDVSSFDCPADATQPVRRVPIGRPIDNHRLYVLDLDDRPQPAGVAGELCIAGAGLARGYLGRPELTREKFVDDPFDPGERMYRTGDLARWLADGTLEYLGRIDDQVKIRGNRVELGEVQNALSSAPGVAGAVVVDRRTAARGLHLVGYYVAADEIDPVLLRAHLATTLPEFMVPAYFVRIDSIPLTPNGKADRRALPEPSLFYAAPEVRPRTEVEATLAAIWCDVLETSTVGVHDNYFGLGGDSILMLRIRAAAARRGLHFALTDLIAHPTVAELATRVTTTAPERDAPAPTPFALVAGVDRARLAAAQDAYPMTRLQLGMLFHSREHDDSDVYHDVFRYTLKLNWDEAAFRRARAGLVARHPVLRSSLHVADFSEPLQVVHRDSGRTLDVVDLRSHTATAAEAVVREHIAARRHHGYVFESPELHLLRVFVRPTTLDLVFSFHHAILDGWSVANLVGELLQDYLHAIGMNIEPVAAAGTPSPAAYVRAERIALSDETTRRYWRDRLHGAAPAPIESFRPYEPPGDGAPVTRRVPLPARLDRAIRRFAHDHALPLKSVLFAAHCLTLRLLTGGDDVITGLVTHGRPEQPDAERLTGLFLNTVPGRLDPTPRNWLDTVRAVFDQEREGYPYRRYPLSAIQADHGAEVLQTAFNYVNFHQLTPLLATAGVELCDVEIWERTHFALLVNAITDPRDGRVHLRIDGDGRTITAAQADLFGRHYLEILRRIVDRPREAADLAFLTTTGGADVVRWFEHQALQNPRAVALSFSGSPGQRWSYEELDEAANRVAQRLIELGPPPGARVGIAMDRSPEMIAAVLGIAKAGAACVPLDVSYPPQRIAAMVGVARPFRIIAHARHAHLVDDPALLLSAESVTAAGTAGERLAPAAIAPESVAYVLFTSGSTGEPKGVAMPHRALANLVAWQNRRASGALGGTTLQFAPLSFDVSFQEIFSTLCGGGTLRLVHEDERRDMARLLRLLDRDGVERVFLPYVALQQLAETAQALDVHPRKLRVLVSSGEQLRVTTDIRKLCRALPGAILENQYGPTETHVVTAYPMSGDPDRFPAQPPIGQAIDGAEVHLLDAGLRPVPEGARGEIYVGGACLAEGYEGRPDLTRERFVAHPTGRLYRTGDLGRRLPGGDIVCLDRVDAQVKVRGFRVEPAEVELAILGLAAHHPGIREVAVVARRRDTEAYVAAFLVGDESRVDLEDVRRQLRASLPDHLVPARFAWLPRLPRTPSGKRDDARLREIPLAPVAVGAQRTPPRDEYERVLADLVADLLRVPTPGAHDDFFALGGTSLSAMRIVVMIEKRYGMNVPLSAFVKAPTIAELAGRLRGGGMPTAFDPLVPIRTEGSRPPLFLVHPIGGNVLCYVRLAQALPADQPVYALQAAGTEPGTEPLRDLPALARSYLDAVRRVQPEGPYTIGGWSFGGFVAYEMACQLRRAGAQVDHLVLLDTIIPTVDGRPSVHRDLLFEWFLWELLWLARGGATAAATLPPGLTDDEAFDAILRHAVDAGVLPDGCSSAHVRRLFGVFEANWQALLSYRPEPVDQDLTLLRAGAPLPDVLAPAHRAVGSMHLDPTNGWSTWTTGRVDVVDVPGDHLQMMEPPHITTVARRIRDLTCAQRSAR